MLSLSVQSGMMIIPVCSIVPFITHLVLLKQTLRESSCCTFNYTIVHIYWIGLLHFVKRSFSTFLSSFLNLYQPGLIASVVTCFSGSLPGKIAHPSCVGDFLTLGTNFKKIPCVLYYSHVISIQYDNRH